MKSRRFSLAIALVILSIVMVVGVVFAAAVALDTFDAAGQNLTASNLSPTAFEAVTDTNVNILGQERDVELLWNSGSGISVQVNQGSPASGALAFSQDNATSGQAWIVWDGLDNSATIVPDGLCSSTGCPLGTGVDLTGSGTNDAFHIEIPYDDLPFAIRLRVFSGSLTAYQQYILNVPGNIGTTGPSHVDFLVPFTSFTAVGGGALFTNVGAVEMYFDGRPTASIGGDVSIAFLDADNFRDFGDAPNDGINWFYGNPSHFPLGIRLGESVDAEPTAQFSTFATGDNALEADDEQGVIRDFTQQWTPGATVDLFVLMKGCPVPTNCRLNGWIDWDNDGTFDTPRDRVFNDVSISYLYNGTLWPRSITIPADAPIATGSNTSFYARFRICAAAATCNNPTTADVLNGEVEDYYWGFGPTAVSLESFTPAANSTLPVIGFVGFLALAIVSLGAIIVRREQKRA